MRTETPNFTHVVYPVSVPDLIGDREVASHPVLVAGGGPVGLATALTLAQRGIRVLVVEADSTVCAGSRAICLSRRTLEILDCLGALKAFQDKGLPWTRGRSFHGSEEVLRFTMPHDSDQRLAPMTNLQQYYIEQFLLDAVQQHRDLIEMRWGTRLEGLEANGDGVDITLLTDSVSYKVRSDYLVACDGARSRVRQALNLKMSGTSYEGRYIIVDIEIDVDLPTERLAWFNPPSNPGRTILMHRQPDNVWRLDYQLRPDEDPDEMLRDENVLPIVQAHLAMMGIEQPWTLIWSSMYRATAVSLDSYRSGRVLFAGDAAHLVPIFGVRGLNSGFEDAFNLGWKLASVIRGAAPDEILESYSYERKQAWQTNIASAMKSTEFMAPPSYGYELMRDATLSLAKRHPDIATLADPRQASTIAYESSSLNTTTRDEPLFKAGSRPGTPVSECLVVTGEGGRYLTQLIAGEFTLVWSGKNALPVTISDELKAVAALGVVVRSIEISGAQIEGSTEPQFTSISCVSDRFVQIYDAGGGAAYLFRPDGYVCARWRALRSGDLTDAIKTALSRSRTK